MSRINKNLLPLKALLFFLYAAIGCLMPFVTLHMYHIGLSHEEVIWINTVLPATALIGPTVGGYLADRFGNYRLIIISSMVLAAIFHTSLLFVPERLPPYKPTIQMVCGPEGSALVLQSCTGECPLVQNDLYTNFRISNCRQECDIKSKSCSSFNLPEKLAGNNSVSEHMPAEIDLQDIGNPNVCFQEDEEMKNTCKDFHFNTFFDINRNFNSSSLSLSSTYFSIFGDCCEYPLTDYSSDSQLYNNMTCNSKAGCYVICEVSESENTTLVLQSETCLVEGDRPKLTFWLYFFLRSCAEMFPAILISLFDAVVLTMVTLHGGDYGRQKMFGLFAIGISAPLVGYIMDSNIGLFGSNQFGPVFYVFDGLLLLTAIITLTLPLKVEVQRSSMLKNLSQLIRTYELNLLLVVVVLLGLLYGYLETFLYIHMLENLHSSKLLLGLTITVGIVPSVPFLYKSDIIVHYCGHHYLLILAFVGYCIRFAGLSYLSNPLCVLPLEVLELLSLNLMQVSAATLAFKLAPKTLVATAQSLVWIAHFDVGRALGTIIGGYLIQIYGMIAVFRIASVFSAACAIIYLGGYQIFKYTKNERARKASLEQTKQITNGTVVNGRDYMPLPLTNNEKC